MSLECWVYGSDIEHCFVIHIQSTTMTVASLKKVIKDEKRVDFSAIDADKLDLYSIPSPGNLSELEHWTPEGKRRLPPRVNVVQLKDDLIIVNMHTLVLNCWVRGHDIGHVFPVKIPSTETVASLKKAIKSEKPVDFGAVDAEKLDLCKISLPYDNHLSQALKELASDRTTLLTPMAVLSGIFGEAPPPKHVHVIIEPPHVSASSLQANESDDALTLLVQSFIRTTTITSRSLTPSQTAKSSEYAKFQSEDRRILDCRSSAVKPVNTVAPPIQLFHPAFAYFSSKAFDPAYDVPDSVVREVRDLMAEFSLIFTKENARQSHLKSLLSAAINYPLTSENNSDKTLPDFVVRSSCGASPTYLVVGEEKNEFGDGGSDPSAQAAFSFMRTVSQHEVKVTIPRSLPPCFTGAFSAQMEKLRLKCCCPAFIIAHAGPWLTIMGGVVTSNCIVQRLTDFLWIPVHSTHDDGQFRRIARVFYALRESIEALDSWYKSVDALPAFDTSVSKPHPRFFPSARAYRDGDSNTLVEFAYQKPLENDASCVTYHAKTLEDNPKDVVVKFVTSYGVDVHREMASAGYAPKILYYGPINVTPDMPTYGDLRMVVMEYVNGWTLGNAFAQAKVPGSFESDIRHAFKHLHDSGYVCGDLRSPNIMITTEGKLRLIDFDWAGKTGEVRYPAAVSRSVDWPAGVQGGAFIRQEHDRAMLDNLISQYCSG
ncbi:hypothetical protein JVU11DRAFT_7204 [Chiua virens]|nr:hypothetical protein JVU11DRAFT_7204 [Chiua virens]